MSELSREEGALTRAADMVRSAHGDLTREVNSMPQRLATKGAWEGGGASGFTNLVTVWNTETDKIVRALNDFEANLTGADVTYTQTDDVQLDTYSQISARMGGGA
jgi:uncharacterized protein YukE